MRFFKISMLALVCILIASSSSLANAPGADNPHALLKDKVAKMIRLTDLSNLNDRFTEATVEFIVTKEREILVTRVDTESNYLETVIKEKLNYKTIDINGIKRNRPYSLKVTFKKNV